MHFKGNFIRKQEMFKVKVTYIASHGLISPETAHRLTSRQVSDYCSTEVLRRGAFKSCFFHYIIATQV